jgi:hypothetical protein
VAVGPPGIVHLIYLDNGVRYLRSDDAGHTWENPVILSTGLDLDKPRVAVDNSGRVHVVWEERATSIEISYAQLNPAGDIELPKARISVDDGIPSHDPHIAADPNECVLP